MEGSEIDECVEETGEGGIGRVAQSGAKDSDSSTRPSPGDAETRTEDSFMHLDGDEGSDEGSWGLGGRERVWVAELSFCLSDSASCYKLQNERTDITIAVPNPYPRQESWSQLQSQGCHHTSGSR